MAKVLINKIKGLFNLKPLYDYLSSHKDGKYMVEIKLVRNPRSLDQNGWLFGCIYPMLLESLGDAGWDFTDTDQVHEFFKAQMVHDKVINKHTGEIIEFPGSTAMMDTVTFSTYCDKLREYAKEYLNTEIPDPDPNWISNETHTKPNGVSFDKTDTDTD